jgi:drug/metabolite transporter (DMT)-like permease
MQLRQRYEGRDFTIRRLRRIQMISDVLFLVAGLLMIANQSNFLGFDQLSYIKYVHNNWVVVLLVAAILQLYTSHRIANELEKDTK